MSLLWTTCRAVVAGSLLGVLALGSIARADEKFSDSICPASVPAVEGYAAVTHTQPMDPAALLTAALAAADMYEQCASQQRADQRVEPRAHYAQFRAAQYFVVAARVELQLGKPDAARKHLALARQETTDVIGWQPFGVGGATTHSVWADKSKAVLEAADETAKTLPSPEPKQKP